LLTVFEAVDDRPSVKQVVDKCHQLPAVNNLTPFEQDFDSQFKRRVEFSVFCSVADLAGSGLFRLWFTRPALFGHVIGLAQGQPNDLWVFPGSQCGIGGLVAQGAKN
jgi:hypothetical protein